LLYIHACTIPVYPRKIKINRNITASDRGGQVLGCFASFARGLGLGLGLAIELELAPAPAIEAEGFGCGPDDFAVAVVLALAPVLVLALVLVHWLAAVDGTGTNDNAIQASQTQRNVPSDSVDISSLAPSVDE
jgi:hypothetical protein